MLDRFDFVRVIRKDGVNFQGYLVESEPTHITLEVVDSHTPIALETIASITVETPGKKPLPLPVLPVNQLVALQVSDIAILNDLVQQLSRTLKEGHPSVRGTHAVARDILSGLVYRLGVINTRMPRLEQALGLMPEKQTASTHDQPYQVGDAVRFTGSTWSGTIIAVIPDFEASGETGYAVSMSDESKQQGALPIETVSSKLIEPIPTKPYTCSECGKPLSFPETFFLDGVTQGLTYCQEHLPVYNRNMEGW